jgi:hypothetical protein
MPLSWNEIKDRALRFSREWAAETSEDAEAKSFWDGFFDIFGVSRRRVASFERKVKKVDGKDGYIDLLWKGVLLVEHKSRGKDLDRAHAQARDYFHGLTDAELPKYLLVSDFARFRLYDLDGDAPPLQFDLADLHRHVRAFGFIAGYQARAFKDEDPVNVEAAERMGKLHDALKAAGYAGHALEVLLVRLLFCLFAEDTGIFPRNAFAELVAQRTAADGADLGPWLAQLFQVLDTPAARRQKTLDAQLAEFPYVNGRLFAEALPLAAFDAKMRALLLDAAHLDWSRISPAIFGSMFQSVMDARARRGLGAHYTSEKNILKLIGPLFLDELKAELEKIGNHEGRLKSFHVKLSALRFLDPACGCGNFLVIAYRELRLLEIEVLRRLYARQGSVLTHVADHVAVDVDQFYGIEIEEFPAQIAQVALWLMDHQMNLRVAEQFGEYFARLPLVKSPTIVHGNALRIDWNDVVPRERLSYILGNPPFVGHHLQSAEQKADMLASIGDAKAAGVLDFVSAWYALAAKMMEGTGIQTAFVSTNSITQGEQVGILWRALEKRRKLHIRFAHRTFRWSNEARGKAAVYCVIVGFSLVDAPVKTIFEYEDINGDPHPVNATQINAYLVDAPWVLLDNRTDNPFGMPEMMYGSKPTDDGHFLFTDEEKIAFLRAEPGARKFVKPFISAHEYLHGGKRWVLWLVDADPADIKALPEVQARIKAVADFRAKSKAPTTRAYKFPTLFRQVTQPNSDYVLIPGHTSENRAYIPFGFFDKNSIVGNSCFSLPGATRFHFGIIQSSMHMAWVRYTCGRLESRYRYSKDIVYNNFPWPDLLGAPTTVRTERSRPQNGEVEVPPPGPSTPTADAAYAQGERGGLDAQGARSEKHRAAIETAAQAVLDARAAFPDSTLADLYDPLSMPPALVKAHQNLDRAVDAAYVAAEKAVGRKAPKLTTDAERVAFLFERYQALTSLLPAAKAKRARRK